MDAHSGLLEGPLMAKRITMQLGKLSRAIVVDHSPYPRVGDAITIKGQGAEWTVSKVQEVKCLLRLMFPKGTPIPARVNKQEKV